MRDDRAMDEIVCGDADPFALRSSAVTHVRLGRVGGYVSSGPLRGAGNADNANHRGIRISSLSRRHREDWGPPRAAGAARADSGHRTTCCPTGIRA
ncbi:hypothetical protein EVAR_51755_1 [Eumeta japonica]|uniref:Uncharacterized protein n=1 Tax=Eumeta variegata TaxID=151549 RepID=A0A4C1XD24_EUMVA|nr:hypothetical protein EVAR_51755_1 [Eumeta japonica]